MCTRNCYFTLALFFCKEVIDCKNEPFFFFNLQQGNKKQAVKVHSDV